MHLAVFYGVIDNESRRIRYANAGHPHAFRVTPAGVAERLGATCPPLGLARAESVKGAEVAWEPGGDLLVLVSDGIIDARNEAGERFGETRVIELIEKFRGQPPATMVDEVFNAVTTHAPSPADDRTLLIFQG